MIFKDGKTFSAYVRSKLHSGYITVGVVAIAKGASRIDINWN